MPTKRQRNSAAIRQLIFAMQKISASSKALSRRENSIRSIIFALRGFNVPDDAIKKKLQEQYHLSWEKIRHYMTLH